MVEAVYALCFFTSAAVAILLLRGFVRTRTRFLLWCGIGFIGLCMNNFMLIIDRFVVPQTDLSLVRNLPALIGMCVLVYGLIWDSE